jgi:hypothetical protein
MKRIKIGDMKRSSGKAAAALFLVVLTLTIAAAGQQRTRGGITLERKFD